MQNENSARLLQVKAAAGSGKTYSLTYRFLTLLAQTSRQQHAPVCMSSASVEFSWDEIMAVTFTNKAAMEMKERIVRELKARALGLEGAAPVQLSSHRAVLLLEDVLRRYSRLNIRTIDSLLNLIVRLFALPLELDPDFDLLFSEKDIFDPVYKEFIQNIGTDPEKTDQLEQAALTLIRHDQRAGFWLASTIRQRLSALVENFDLQAALSIVTRQEEIARALQLPYERFHKALNNLSTLLAEHKIPINKHFDNFLGKCRDAKLFDGPPESAMIKKESLCDCVLSKGKALVNEEEEKAYQILQVAYAAYNRQCAVLGGAYSWAPLAELAENLRQAMENYQIEEGAVLCASLGHRAADLLSGGFAVAEAFCRLGNRLYHLLIDEFQDTSRDQWQALLPLGEECLSKLGSLFYVGDIKQAIYGWRGGDAELFAEVARLPELAGPAGGAFCAPLDTNWRSCKNIVRFNNDFFTSLSRPDHADDIAERIFPKAEQSVRDTFAQALVSNFADSTQKIAEKNEQTEGYVRLQRLPGGRREKIDEQTEAAFNNLLSELRQRHAEPSWGDVAVLVRTNTQALQVSQWLVDEGIPVITENSLRMGSHPVIAQLIALLSFIDRPEDDLAFATFISGKDVFLAETGMNHSEIMEWLSTSPKRPLYLAFRNDFPEEWALIEPLFAHAGIIGPYDMAAEAIRAFRVLERRPGDELFIRRLLELVHQAEENKMPSLSRFLEFWKEQGTEESVPLPQGMNAVQVMTMHKAKGLEFPIVILPFLDWSIPRLDRELAVIPIENEAYVTSLSRNVGEAYWDKMLEIVQEQCNLLYVAFTRPRNELYGFFPAERGSKKPSPILEILQSYLGEDLDDEIFEAGVCPVADSSAFFSLEKVPSSSPIIDERPLSERNEPYQPMSWLPRLRVYRNLEDADNWRNRQRGEIVHKALEYLLDFPETGQAVSQAVSLAVDDFPLSSLQRLELSSQTETLIQWLLSREDMRYCLRHGRPEAEILGADGRQHRVDLLCSTPTGPMAVEYKTGKPSPDHHDQVCRYLGLLDSLPGREERGVAPARGLIVYLDRREVVEVEGGKA